MRDFETMEIQLSKVKTTILFFGCLLFLAIGVAFVISPEKYKSFIARSSALIFLAGCAGILFFGFIGFSLFRKLLDKKPGLIISIEGITDNSSGVSAGFIPWSDIIAVKEILVVNQRILNLVVKNPQEYIDRQKSKFKRKIMQENYDKFGAAISITTNFLKINYRELKGILEQRISGSSVARN